MKNILILLIPIATFVLYTELVKRKFGVLRTISHSAYKVKDRRYFFLFTSGVSIPIIFVGFDSWIIKLAGVMMFIVGVVPYFKNKFEGAIHNVAALGCIAIGHLGLWVSFEIWYVPFLAAISSFVVNYSTLKNKGYWIEYINFWWIIVGMIIYTLK